jgi:DHA3 family macrolide efflux protein-like MFS transporter
MNMIKALRNRSIALLWSGQAASAIGDEIYRVALIWLAVGLIGADTGYLAAGQSAALLLLSVLGGRWADHWDHFKTMICVDVLRGLLVLVPVIFVHFMPLSMSILWVVALSLASLSAFFDPAIQAVLPGFSADTQTLQAANGLMSTTLRLARVAGPGIIGVLVVFIPTIHFFSLDALTFLVSAVSIYFLKAHPPQREVSLPGFNKKKAGFRESVVSGFQALDRDPSTRSVFRFVMLSKAVTGGAWSLAYGLGLALFVHKVAPHDVRAFGSLIAAYGVGNLSSALVLGNMDRRRSNLIQFLGYSWLGVGFILIGLSPNLHYMMAAAAFAAIGGPMNDLPLVDMIQRHFEVNDIPKVYRLRMAVETGATLFAMLMAPALFRIFSVQSVIALCGVVTASVGVVGLLRYGEKSGLNSSKREAGRRFWLKHSLE